MNIEKRNYILCALCASDDTEVVCTKAGGMKRGEPKDVINVICTRCGLLYNNPQLSEEELELYYSEGGYRKNKNAVENYNDFVAYIKRRKSGNSKLVYNFLKPFLKGNSKVVDIGCGIGMVLHEIKRQAGASVVGVEPDKLYVQMAKEYHHIDRMENILFGEFVEKAKKTKEKFDVVIMRHVFEHLPEPNQSLEDLKSLLKEDGFLLLVVPNAANFKPTSNLAGLLEFGHLYHYTPYTMHQMLLKHDMKVVKWSDDHRLALQVIATRTSNPVKAVSFQEMRTGSSVRLLKLKLKSQLARNIVYRAKRKTKTILGLN